MMTCNLCNKDARPLWINTQKCVECFNTINLCDPCAKKWWWDEYPVVNNRTCRGCQREKKINQLNEHI